MSEQKSSLAPPVYVVVGEQLFGCTQTEQESSGQNFLHHEFG